MIYSLQNINYLNIFKPNVISLNFAYSLTQIYRQIVPLFPKAKATQVQSTVSHRVPLVYVTSIVTW